MLLEIKNVGVQTVDGLTLVQPISQPLNKVKILRFWAKQARAKVC